MRRAEDHLHPQPAATQNDGCYVEQKNWSVVRREVGYGRYDTQAERALIAAIYADLRLYVNFFLPSTKLIAKERRGAKVHKRYDKPADALPAAAGTAGAR